MALLPSLLRKAGIKSSVKSQLVLDGKTLDVTLKHNSRARRIILRIDKQGDGLVLTLPNGTSLGDAMEFAASQGAWIGQQLAKQPKRAKFAEGQHIPVRGVSHLVVVATGKRTPVWCETAAQNHNRDDAAGENILGENILYVSGDEKHHPRRIQDWLKKQARSDLTRAAFEYAEKMDSTVRRISIRDTSSRWGSCSSNGALSFSWRLILAPPFVLDYVAAHEVAHLTEMNHSAQFWALVNHHCLATGAAKKWLKANGRSLHRYGL